MRQNFAMPFLRTAPNRWDLVALPLVLVILAAVAWAGADMDVPFEVGQETPISLDPANLPEYSLMTVTRMFVAMAFSLLFTFTYGTLAAKSARAERLMMPLLDVLQSVPILGFLTITVTGFIALFPGSRLGLEMASIFAIFTSQAWNMAFSFYQSLKTVPEDLKEASAVYHLSPWQRFWRLETPFAVPGLLWNMMMSMSGGWFFVVASEAISVSGTDVMLPGIGSYIAVAIDQGSGAGVAWAIAAMLVVILAYDQLFFRPLIAWADKFKITDLPGEERPRSWVADLFHRARLTRVLSPRPAVVWFTSLGSRGLDKPARPRRRTEPTARDRWLDRAWDGLLVVGALACAAWLVMYIHTEVGWAEVGEVFLMGAATGARVMVLILLASLLWVPVGIWIGFRPRVAQRVGPVIQFLAAFPANLFYPVLTAFVVANSLDINIWASPLMILGTQWYILFNVIAAASTVPMEMRHAASNFGLKGVLKWRRFLLPAVFPGYVTGAVTAAGGSWNASIIAEVVQWGPTTLTAYGVGAYITDATNAGDTIRVVLGVSVMCVYVILFNRLFWQRLYDLAEKRLHTS